MHQMTTPVAAILAAIHARTVRRGDDRGDVPGWVLIVLMTAGLVTVLWSLAGTTLETVFTDAIESVVGSGGAG